MFTSNPWAAYLIMLGPVIAGYYLFVGIRFYGRDIKARFTSKGNSAGMSQRQPEQDLDTPDPPARSDTPVVQQKEDQRVSDRVENETDQVPSWQNEELFDQLELLATHLKEAIDEAHAKDYGKQDLILLLQMTLKEYPAMSAGPFRTAINNLIEKECAKYGSIHLREEDKAAIWKQVQ